MKAFLATGLACAAVIGVAAQHPAAHEEAAIRQVVADLDAARNAGRPIAGAFTSDADQLTSSGEWRLGPDGIEKGYEQSHATVYKGGTFVTTIDRIRMLAPDVALADGTFEVRNVPGGGTRHAHISYVLVRTAGRWRISALRSMVVAPPGPTPAK